MILRGAATHALVGGLGLVDAKLKVDREPIRAMEAGADERKRADSRPKAKAAQQGGPLPKSLDVAGEWGWCCPFNARRRPWPVREATAGASCSST